MDRIFELFSTELSAVSVEHLLLCVGLCFVLSLYIILIYRLTYSGVLYSRRFALSLMVLSLVTSVVILAISSNVTMTTEQKEQEGRMASDILTYAGERVAQFAIGDADIDAEWDDFVEKLKSMNIEDCIALEQEAYDNAVG